MQGGYLADRGPASHWSPLAHLQKCRAPGISPACQSAALFCPWDRDTRVRILGVGQKHSQMESAGSAPERGKAEKGQRRKVKV